jgi:hypothetical protein
MKKQFKQKDKSAKFKGLLQNISEDQSENDSKV